MPWRISVPLGAALYLGGSTFAASELWAHAAHADEDSHFAVDPVADGVLTGAGAGFSTLLGLVLSTGETYLAFVRSPHRATLDHARGKYAAHGFRGLRTGSRRRALPDGRH